MLDFLILIIFVAFSIGNGLSNRRRASQGMDEYFLAGRSLTGAQAGISMAATQFAADTPLLVAGLIATSGVFMLWRLWIYAIAFLAMGIIFSRRWRRSGVITDAELTKIRYSGPAVIWLRTFKAIYYGLIINCTILAMVMIAALRITEVFLRWHEWLPVGFYEKLAALVANMHLNLGASVTGLDPQVYLTNSVISIIVLIGFTFCYTTTGGLRSVVKTDIWQFTLAMFGTLIYAVVLIYESGGLGNISSRLVEIYGEQKACSFVNVYPQDVSTLTPFLIFISLQWLFQVNSDGTGYLAQRSLACRSDKDAVLAAYIFSWLQIVIRSSIWIAIGITLLVLYPIRAEDMSLANFAAQREMFFVMGINDYMPTGVRGIMLAAMLAALASTVDTHLNWGASYLSNDLYGGAICERLFKRVATQRELVVVARISNLVIVLIALVVMAHLGSIQAAWQLSLLFGAGVGPVLVLRWLWERINIYCETVAIVTSMVFAPLVLLYIDSEHFRLLTMAVISATVTVSTALITRRPAEGVLSSFYQKVRPSGFWSRMQQVTHDTKSPRNTFKTEVFLLIISAISLFAAFIGVIKLLFRCSTESWLFPLSFLMISIATGLYCKLKLKTVK